MDHNKVDAWTIDVKQMVALEKMWNKDKKMVEEKRRSNKMLEMTV